MELTKMTAALEAILFACGDPIETDRICEVLEIDRSTVNGMVKLLNDRYEEQSSALQILTLDNRLQMTTKPSYAVEIRKALEVRRNQPLSQAAFEVLSVIAYNQPVTKAFVEQVRGVDCTGVISGLCEKGLIEENGRLDLPGRPLLYVTTPSFLRCFGLRSLSDLPPIPQEEPIQQEETQEQEETPLRQEENT